MTALSSPTAAMAAALHGLDQALDAPRQHGVALGNWRWVVRQRMAVLRDALVAEGEHSQEGWLAARGGTVLRERNALLGRLSALGPHVLETSDAEEVRLELKRLLRDAARHVQRLHDLAYDAVEMEIGGSE
ncbi:MAG: hypothetical protein ACXVWZ_09200 [Nocardioides sp.]